MRKLALDDVRQFLERNQEVFEWAIVEVEPQVGFFLTNGAHLGRFSVEQIENARIKDARRVFAKARRKGLSDAADLLRRCDEALAEQLNAADLLLARLEDAADAVRAGITPRDVVYGVV